MSNFYHSQSGQDKYINEVIFKGRKEGTFLDIGANDGITYSNTYFFEKQLNWKGICFEPIPIVFNNLQKNRASINIEACVADFSGKGVFYEIEGYAEMLSGLKSKYDTRHLNRIKSEIELHGGKLNEIEVNCIKLDDILKTNNFDYIDYCSIDIEGGELDVLKTINFDQIPIDVISVENNYNDNGIEKLLKKNKYKKLIKLDGDEIYKRLIRRKYFFW